VSTASMIEEMVEDVREFVDGPLDGLDTLLGDLAALGEGPAPTPGPELATLLAGDPAARPVVVPFRPPASRRRRLATGLAAAALTGVTLTGVAAAANELPAPVQRLVAHFSETFLPFDLPRPAGDPPRTTSTGDAPSVLPVRAPADGSGSPAVERRAPAGPTRHGPTSPPAGTAAATDTPADTPAAAQPTPSVPALPTEAGVPTGVPSAPEPQPSPTHAPSTGHAFAGDGDAGQGTPPTAQPTPVRSGHPKPTRGPVRGGPPADPGSARNAGGDPGGASSARSQPAPVEPADGATG